MATSGLDSRGRPLVAVTGMGVVTSLGRGRDDNWRDLVAGKSGIHRIGRFPTEGLKTTIAATVDFVETEPFCAPKLSEAFATMAVEEALAQAGLGGKAGFPGPLIIAVPPVELEWPQREAFAASAGGETVDYRALCAAAKGDAFASIRDVFLFNGVADRVAERFGTRGAPITLSTACSSGATSIQLAVEAIRRGEAEAAIAVGTDGSVQAEALIRFSLLSALSTSNNPPESAAKPFSKNRDGFVMGEGAGALILESHAHAVARGARILGYVAGVGDRGDGFHRTRSSPDGKPAILAVQDAIEDAGLTPAGISTVNAHGTGTPENDKMETLSCAAVFGERWREVPITSNKSMIGHTLTAAGAVEAVVSLLTIAHQRIPPTINYAMPDPAIQADVVGNKARDARVATVLSNSFGFGGQNTCLVLAGEPAA